MRSLLVVCCFSVVCLQASAVLEVTGHVGEQVSIPCFGSWTENNSSEDHTMFFCKGVCSAKNNVVQTRKMRSAATWRGRYSIGVSGGDRAFSAAIRDVRRRDAGTYCCGMEDNLSVMQQEVHLRVLKASSVLLGSPLPTAPPQTETETPPQGSFASGTGTPPTASTPPATEDTRNHTAAGKLKDTTVVIIVSVSLAFLVCAFIPLIFYRYWFSNKGGENKVETENCEEHAAVPSTPRVAMRLQSLDADTESSVDNLSQ
ncbi:uncharacterized protein LOC119217559 [Pungitius pungitius]|uniref:uncharacterized protein LOC119217559 n=1 Tax=Pungitius pungitius TaxID=134920 RepID=UPI002E0EAB6E